MALSCTRRRALEYVIAIAAGCSTLCACARKEEPLKAQSSCYSQYSRAGYTSKAAIRLDVREKDWPAFMAAVRAHANSTGLELAEFNRLPDKLQFNLCSDAGIQLTAWALHFHGGPPWQHSPDDGIKVVVSTASPDANWQPFLAQFEAAMAREGMYGIPEPGPRPPRQTATSASIASQPTRGFWLGARLFWHLWRDPVTNRDAIDTQVTERAIEESYATLISMLDTMALARPGEKRDELQSQIARSASEEPAIFTVEIDDDRPPSAVRTDELFLRDGRPMFEFCSEPVSAVIDDGLIRCSTTTEHQHLSVLRYTKPVEHGGDGWLLIVIRFEYDALLARLSERRKSGTK